MKFRFIDICFEIKFIFKLNFALSIGVKIAIFMYFKCNFITNRNKNFNVGNIKM